MKLSEQAPRLTDRALFVGQTGSGKTTLAREMLKFRRFVVVLDAKGTLNWPEYRLIRTLKKLAEAKEPKLLYRPTHDELYDGATIERFFEWVYQRGNTTVYIDEAYAVTDGEQLPRFYHACLTRGRERGIETWSATQRPMRIPQVIMSESEHLYAFRLAMPQDRNKVEAICSLSADLMHRLPKHWYYYAPQDADARGPFKMTLDG